MTTPQPLLGLTAATHTPFAPDGGIDLGAVEVQAAHLIRTGVSAAFVGGTTGESHSLTVDERLSLAARWVRVAKGTPLRVVVHVGGNCLADARTLAEQADRLGVAAVAALAPAYFKPRTLDDLVACSAAVASAAPGTPFYFYDIPEMTGVRFPMPDYLDVASSRIPTFAGLKFTNPDMMAFQRCLHAQGGRFDVTWGTDEWLLAALALGGRGAVGSTYNLAAPIYVRMIRAFEAGDLPAARVEQYRSVRLVEVLSRYGFMAAAKAVMVFLGVSVGPPRLPHAHLTDEKFVALRKELSDLGFFEWVAA